MGYNISMTSPTIGVFDSGVGGEAVVSAIKAALPGTRVVYIADKKHLPYGNKPLDHIVNWVLPKLLELEAQGCQIIVIACNTVTTNLIDQLRPQLSVPLVGMEPMVKPAADLTKTGVIAVCATPNTLRSQRYQQLKQAYAGGVLVLEPDCSDWAMMIENNQIDQGHIKQRLEAALDQKADVIVLGCTHYHWIEELIRAIAGDRALVLQPEEPVIAQLQRVLQQLA